MDHQQINGQKVSCMDIEPSHKLLISGYKNGSIGLWDLQEYKLLKFFNGFHESEVTNVKIYEINSSGSAMKIVSCEENGGVKDSIIKKGGIFGGYSHSSEFLFSQNKLKATTTISAFQSNKDYPSKFCDTSNLVAFGGLNMLTICTMKPVDCIYTVSKPIFCKEESVPYIAWGFGLTPSHRESTVPIMAYAWDKVIQLLYINEESLEIKIDGFYYSDKEIISLHFIADSILYAVFDNKDCYVSKIIYTPKLYPDSYRHLEEAYEHQSSYLS